MFTGIITHKSQVRSISIDNNLLIIGNELGLYDKGTSVSVDGACLTISGINNSDITFDVSNETINKTIIKNYTEDSVVNLELPIKNDSLFSGHLVLGHVDTIASVHKIQKLKNGVWEYFFSIEDDTLIVDKGSITVNGISLTSNYQSKNIFQVSIISETYARTNLSNIDINSNVNIEYDIIGKYVHRFINDKWY